MTPTFRSCFCTCNHVGWFRK